MLDDLREQISETDFDTDVKDKYSYAEDKASRKKPNIFFGMTPVQRFVIAVLVFLMICVLGVSVLLVFEKIVLPV